MHDDYSYRMYQLSVKLLQHAERSVVFPGDQEAIDYCRQEAKVALQTIRGEGLIWQPVAKPYKGVRSDRKGWTTVALWVRNTINYYGWTFPPEQAQAIYANLHAMWTAYNHNEEIDEILSKGGQNDQG